ncbi:MAG: hypothetical protein DRP47_01670 [Candidatus Zixiibacteriota bacterium]|nr:MAG: hypothetical protein DRP47_01670 [candidate division Zixibacteria bacterium]
MDLNKLANIRVIDCDRIRTYEWNNPISNGDNLLLEEVRFVRHPFLVTSLDDDFLLLEERASFDALADAGLCHFPVQIADPSKIGISVSKIGLFGFEADDLIQLAARHHDQIIIESLPTNKPTMTGYLPIEFVFRDNRFRMLLRHSTQAGCPPSLDFLFRSILRQGRFESIVERTEISGAVTRKGYYSGTMILPQFSLSDLKSASMSDNLYPPGLFEISVDCRVLNIDFPINVLLDSTDIGEKETFFHETVNLRAQSHKISSFKGQVIILNH